MFPNVCRFLTTECKNARYFINGHSVCAADPEGVFLAFSLENLLRNDDHGVIQSAAKRKYIIIYIYVIIKPNLTYLFYFENLTCIWLINILYLFHCKITRPYRSYIFSIILYCCNTT